jgi:hypothetical protein
MSKLCQRRGLGCREPPREAMLEGSSPKANPDRPLPAGFQQNRDEDAGEPDDDYYDAPAAAAGRPVAGDTYVRRQPQVYQEVGPGAGGAGAVQVMV